MAKLIEFETQRLRLRQWMPSDREPFAALNSDPRVMAFFPSPLTRSDSDAMTDRCHTLIEERGWGFWATESRATQAFLGFVGLHVPAMELPFSPCVEVGWRFAFQYWKNGYATEAARDVLRVGFELLNLPEIVSFCALHNVRSRAVMERLGMRESGSFEHPSVPADSPLRQHIWYRLARGHWRAQAT